MVVVVLPTPPFWLHMAMTRAGPCSWSGSGSARRGNGRPVGPSSAAPRTREFVDIDVNRSVSKTIWRWRDFSRSARADESATLWVAAVEGQESVASSWMRRRVDLAEPIDRHERVDLCRGHRGVAQQLLHHADVGAAVEQVGGEGVPERVRAHRHAQPG